MQQSLPPKTTPSAAQPRIRGDRAWDGLPMPRRIGAILAVAFGVSLSVIDGTIANVALPTIARTLEISAGSSIWVVNAYQLAIVMTLLPFSALGDTLGYRRVYLSGMLLFTVASVGCCLANSLPTLVAARVVQGVGAAAITSVNTTLIRIIYPRRALGRGMGLNATVVAVSSVAGPTIAAGILSVASWPWLFAINLPIGAVGLVLCYRFLPANPVRISGRRIDWRDALLNALTFGLLLASVEGFSHGLDPRLLVAGIAGLLVVGTLYLRRQRRDPYPLLPLDLLHIPIFSMSVLTSILSYTAQMMAMVALPFYLQRSLGYDEVETGLLLTAWPAIVVCVAPVAGALVGRIHAGWLGGVGLSVMGLGMGALALLPVAPTHWMLVAPLLLCGGGFALFQSPNNSILIASAPPERSGSASGMLATARLIGQTSGAAFVALLFHLTSDERAHLALLLAAGFALAAALISFSRLSLPLPEALRRKRA